MIDSATEACSVALFAHGDDAEAPAFIAGEFRLLGRGHAEDLVPMIAALPDHGRADRIVVALGPGSFTGVRVGLAAARALAFAWGAELLGYPTLALIAAQARSDHPGSPVCAVMTGGHGEWFVQPFDAAGLPLSPLASLTPAVAAERMQAALVAGSQAEALIARRGSGTALPIWPDARQFAALAPSALTTDTAPLYGRAPDARLPAARQPAIPSAGGGTISPQAA